MTPRTTACQASLSITSSQSLLKLKSIESVMPSSHLILCCPFLLLPSIFPSIRVFSSEKIKVLEFQLQHQSFQRIFRTISFRMDWLDLLAVQGTFKHLLQHHSSKASILWRSAFFIVQLSHPYMTTGKTIALTRWTFVGKVMSLLFNMLSRLVITFHISIHIYVCVCVYIYMSFLVYSSAMTSTLFYWSHRSREDHRGCDIKR